MQIAPYLLGTTKDGNYKYEGFIKDLSDEIAELLGVDYEIKPVKDARLLSTKPDWLNIWKNHHEFIKFLTEDFYPRYGSKDEDGNWDGMIGEIIRGVRQ